MAINRKSDAARPQSLPQEIWLMVSNGQLQPVDPNSSCTVPQRMEPEPQANGDNEQLSAQGYIPHTELYGGLWSNASTPTRQVELS